MAFDANHVTKEGQLFPASGTAIEPLPAKYALQPLGQNATVAPGLASPVSSSLPQLSAIAPAPAAPTVAAGAGSIPAATVVHAKLTYVQADGSETNAGAIGSFTIGGSPGGVTVTSPAWPVGNVLPVDNYNISQANVYLASGAGSYFLAGSIATSGGNVVIATVPASGTQPPTVNGSMNDPFDWRLN